MFVFNTGCDLGEAVGWDVDGVGVDECDGKLDFETFAEGAGDLDVEKVADAEEATGFNRDQASGYLHF